MKESEAKKRFGKAMWNKMMKTGYLRGITVTLKNGEMDIPESDLSIAYRAAKGEKIHELEWD